MAIPMAVQMVFPLLGEKLDGAIQPRSGFNGPLEGGKAGRAGKKRGLPAQLGGGMRVRIGNKLQCIQHGHPAIHGRIGGQAGFRSMHQARQIAIAFLQGRKLRKRAQQGEVGCPDMGGDIHRLRACVQHRFQQIPAVHAQNGPAVAVEIAHRFQPMSHIFRIRKGWQQKHMMYLPGLAVLFIDGADFPGQHKQRRRRGRPGQATGFLQPVQPLPRFLQLLLQLPAPGRMGEIPGADQGNSLRPG